MKRKIFLTESQLKDLQARLAQARQDTNTNASEEQKKAGNYKHGRISIQGFEIAIENPKGSLRSGKDKSGKAWSVKIKNDYGYFTRTLGKDGDAVDVFLGPNLESKTIYCVDQKISGKFDETKVMLGFNSKEEAKDAYMANYNEGWNGFWKITAVTVNDFKDWLYDGYRQRKPFFEYDEIKKKKLDEGKSGIHIKKENEGKFTETKKRTGKSTEELTHSKNPLTRKRAIFAQNAKKWNKK